MLGLDQIRRTRLSSSSQSPNTRAPVGQVWTQAGTTSPSSSSRSAIFASSFASRIRWTQKVHFSITPADLTVTSGLS